MILRNDQGQEITVPNDYQGYDCYFTANEHWGRSWSSYLLLDGDRIIEQVLNSHYLEPVNRQ